GGPGGAGGDEVAGEATGVGTPDARQDEAGQPVPPAAEMSHDDLVQEVDRLRASNAGLRASNSALLRQREEASATRQARHRARTLLAVILVVLGSILAPCALVSVWARNTVNNTDQFVATAGPLASDPTVQSAVANHVTNAIDAQVNVPALVAKALPPQAATLAGPLSTGVKSFINTAVTKVVASPQFRTVWYGALRAAHSQMVGALEGTSSAGLKVSNGTVTLDLSQLVNQVKAQLSAQGFTAVNSIPTSRINGTITLVQSNDISKIQSAYGLLNALGDWLPVIALAFLVAGVLLATNRRRGLAWAAFGVFLALLVGGLGFYLLRHAYLARVPPNVLPRAAASSVFDIITKFLSQSGRALAVLAGVVWLVAFLAGPARGAGTIRRAFTSGVGRLGDMAEGAGLVSAPVRRWTADHSRLLMIADVVLVVLILFLWSHPTAAVVGWMALLGLFLLLVIQFLAHRIPPAEVATAPSANGSPLTGTTVQTPVGETAAGGERDGEGDGDIPAPPGPPGGGPGAASDALPPGGP
ncbi:MAG TPA: hypothetical protein VE152_11170, partial [Acidimicrobiales bacterium]|nr:hypothetical protein [Acidimicrobiales bacterium]